MKTLVEQFVDFDGYKKILLASGELFFLLPLDDEKQLKLIRCVLSNR